MLVEEAVYRKVTEGLGAIMALPAATERHKFVLIFLYWVGGGGERTGDVEGVL